MSSCCRYQSDPANAVSSGRASQSASRDSVTIHERAVGSSGHDHWAHYSEANDEN